MRENGNPETNMAEADLSPTTFTSRSASDPDYDISAEDSSENENENTYTEALLLGVCILRTTVY